MKEYYVKSFVKLWESKDVLNMTPSEVRIHIFIHARPQIWNNGKHL